MMTVMMMMRWPISSVQFSSAAQSCLTLCNPIDHSMPGLPIHHQLPEFTQTHVHRVSKCHLTISSSAVPFTAKASILWCSAFFILQLSHPYMTTGKTIALTSWTFVDKVIWYLSFSFWLTSLCIIGSRFIHLIRNVIQMYSFLWLSNISLCLWATASLSIHLSVDI